MEIFLALTLYYCVPVYILVAFAFQLLHELLTLQCATRDLSVSIIYYLFKLEETSQLNSYSLLNSLCDNIHFLATQFNLIHLLVVVLRSIRNVKSKLCRNFCINFKIIYLSYCRHFLHNDNMYFALACFSQPLSAFGAISHV